MTENFRIIKPEQVKDNPFKAIGSDWMLIAVGTLENLSLIHI